LKILIPFIIAILLVWIAGYRANKSTSKFLNRIKEEVWLLQLTVILIAMITVAGYLILTIISIFWQPF